MAVYDVKDKCIAATRPWSLHLSATPTFVTNAMNSNLEGGRLYNLGGKKMYLYALPLHREESVAGALVIIQDPSYIQDRLLLTWKSNFIRLLVYALVISLTTLLLIRWSIAGPIAKMTEWMKHLRTENNQEPLHLPSGGVFEWPLSREVAQMARSISAAREAAGAVEMAAAVMGGREELRRRPILSVQQCTVSPLGHDGGSLEAALIAAEHGIPTGFMTMAACMTSGPVTLAGNLAVGNAEVIDATALLQLGSPSSKRGDAATCPRPSQPYRQPTWRSPRR